MLVVLGAFRSGTSLVSALLTGLGADFGRTQRHYPPADRHNPLGYFQLPEVVGANRALLRAARVHLAAPPHPDKLRAFVAQDWLEGLDPPRLPPAIKNPRLSLTLACWFDAGLIQAHSTRLVVVERNPERVADSALAHPEVAGHCGRTRAGALAMTRGLQEAARWHAALPGVHAHSIAYEELLADPAARIARLADFLGGADALRQQQALALIGKDAALRRHYVAKLTRPGAIASAAWKSLRAALR